MKNEAEKLLIVTITQQNKTTCTLQSIFYSIDDILSRYSPISSIPSFKKKTKKEKGDSYIFPSSAQFLPLYFPNLPIFYLRNSHQLESSLKEKKKKREEKEKQLPYFFPSSARFPPLCLRNISSIFIATIRSLKGMPFSQEGREEEEEEEKENELREEKERGISPLT